MNQETNTHGSEQDNLHYLRMLAKQYPTVQAASTEIINLQAILILPKGTEHFISDVHGEYEAFQHILNSASGVVREKIDQLFATSVSKADRDQLATLIYYPREKLEELQGTMNQEDMEEWYRLTFHRLIEICCLVSSKYTRSKVRKAMPKEYAYIIDELIHTHYEDTDKRDYYENIISTIIELDRAGNFLVQLCQLIKRLAVDHLHIVGDIFDRGPGADIILDALMEHHSVDIQWGNHDVLWMGAASGSRTLVATVLVNSLRYNNLDVIETGYGISLRPLSVFAAEVYRDCDVSRFEVKLSREDEENYNDRDKRLAAQMYKAITIILFKLEGQKIMRNPCFRMDDRLLLDKINYEDKTVVVDGKTYPLEDTDFPTVDPADPYTLTPEEDRLINQLTRSFRHSEKLQRHVRFLYSKGSLYHDPQVCEKILHEFGLEGEHSHIINGHIPVKSKKGESPVKGGGKLIVIDGGFCKAYQKTTGIAGYTLIYNSNFMRLVSHQPFAGRERAIHENWDISSSSEIFERMEQRMKIRQTDVGRQLQEQIRDLKDLVAAYRAGEIVENHS